MSDAPRLAPQQEMMLSLAQALDDCASDITRAAEPTAGSVSRGLSSSGWRAVGRLQGVAIGCRAIAALAASDDLKEATP